MSRYNFFAGNLWNRDISENKGKFSGSSTVIATFSVGVSLFVMVLAITISDGFKREIRDKAAGFSGDIILTAPGVEPESDLYPVTENLSYYTALASMPGIKGLSGFAYRSGMIKNGDLIQGVFLKGVKADYDWDFFRSSLSEGKLPDFSDSLYSDDILVSKRLASQLELNVGDQVRIYFIDNNVRVSKFKICGLYDAQLEEIDKTLIIADIRQVRRLNNWGVDEISGLEISVDRDIDVSQMKNRIKELIYSNSTAKDPSVAVSSLDELFPHLFDWLRLLDFNVLVVMILMVFVAGFNMISGLLILLFEKISTIGLFKALGMRNMDIHKIFLYRSSAIVLKGMAAGNAAALIFALLEKWFCFIHLDPSNYFVKAVPIHIDLGKIALMNITAYLAVMLLLLLPSLFISKITPQKSMVIK